jgi:copper chaperone CopZ
VFSAFDNYFHTPDLEQGLIEPNCCYFHFPVFQVLIINFIHMKSINFIMTAVIAVVSGVITQAQSHDHSKMISAKTESFLVRGACNMCKERIEKAAKIDGVSKAEWNKDSKILTLVYDPVLTNSDKVKSGIAAAGHDTEKIKADDKTYNQLPGCCKYKRGDL